MVVIECPHCDEELEMDDDSFGIFECPLCEMEYEWGEESDDTMDGNYSHSFNVEDIVAAAYSLLLLIIIIVGLGSTSWYSITETYSEFDLEVDSRFGLSEVETTVEGNAIGYAEDGDYESLEEMNNKNADSEKEMCEMADSDQCDLMKEKADWYGSWDSSGFTMKIFLILALLSSIALLCIKGAVILEAFEKVYLSEELLRRLSPLDLVCSIATAVMLVLGCLIFAIICPGLTDNPMIPSGEISGGLGSMWWTMFVFTLGSLVIPIKKITSMY